MKANRKALSIYLLAILLFSAYTKGQPTYYAYQVDDFSIGKGKTLVSSSRVISCGDYLFEFKVYIDNDLEGDRYVDEKKTVITKVTTWYDTIGVYILAAGKRYYEFDTFALTSKLVKKGAIAFREFGFKLGTNKAKTNRGKSYPRPRFSSPKDTIINGISCHYAEVIRTRLPTDSMGTQYFLIKNKHFTSLYKAQGFRWLDSNYCVIGIYHYAYDGRGAYLQEISNLRTLTTAERKICESLIRKAGLPLPK